MIARQPAAQQRSWCPTGALIIEWAATPGNENQKHDDTIIKSDSLSVLTAIDCNTNDTQEISDRLGLSARTAGARAPVPRRAARGRAGASARAAWPPGAARVLAANCSGRVGPDTPSSFSTSANPGFITRTAILLTPSWILRESPVGIMLRRKLSSLYDPHI